MNIAVSKNPARKIFAIWALCVMTLSIFVAPIAGAEGDLQNPEVAELEVRVAQRWAALVDRNFFRVYEFETPAFKKVYSAPQFASQFGSVIVWREAEIATQEISGDVAEVTVAVRYELIAPDMNKFSTRSYLKESWVRKNGTWFHVTK